MTELRFLGIPLVRRPFYVSEIGQEQRGKQQGALLHHHLSKRPLLLTAAVAEGAGLVTL